MTMAQQIAALKKLDVAGLAERYETLFGKAPRIRHKDWLFGRVAWKVQEQALGGLDAKAKSRLAALMADIHIPVNGTSRTRARLPRRRKDDGLTLGTTLRRTWHDTEYVVRVTDAGIEWNGVVYRSLTAVAKAITGTHWNGRLFFGLTKRGKAS